MNLVKNNNYKNSIYCSNCSLLKAPIVQPNIFIRTNKNPIVWIIGEAPGGNEIKQGKPFVGRAGQVLRDTLKSMNWQYSVIMTNACLCYTGEKPPSIKNIEQCRHNLIKLKENYPPDLIIALGNYAAKSIGLNFSKLDDIRGQVFNTQFGKCFVTIHPSRVLKSDFRLKNLFKLDLRKAVYLLNQDFQQWGQTDILKEENLIVLQDTIEIEKLLNDLAQNDDIKAIDVETSIVSNNKWESWGLDPHHPKCDIYSFSIAIDDKGYAFKVKDHPDEHVIKEQLKHFLSKTRNLVAHNAKFEAVMCKKHIGVLPKFIGDSMVLAYLICETMQGYYNLQSLVSSYTAVSNKWKDTKFIDLYKYNAMDSLLCLHLYKILLKEVESLTEKNFIFKAHKFIIDIVLPLIVEVELNGVYIDSYKLLEMTKDASLIQKEIENRIYQLLGISNPRAVEFKNKIASLCKQNGLELPKSETGQISVTTQGLQEIYNKIQNVDNRSTDLLKKVILYKLSHVKIDKILSVYLSGYTNFLNKQTNRVYPKYRIDGTKTGRLSCEDPNFQQIPRDGVKICASCNLLPVENSKECVICKGPIIEKFKIKDIISCQKGNSLISADYSQMEVRILADMTRDKRLIEVLTQGLDMHSYTASCVYNIPYEEIIKTKDKNPEIKKMRQIAKSATFGIIYGITSKGLALQTGLTETQALKLIEKFYETYPFVKKWIDNIHNTVKENGWVATPIGRIRHFDINIENEGKVLREAQNFPIQSYASDLTLVAAYKIMHEIQGINGKVVGLVHDSIKVEVHQEYENTAILIMENIMKNWVREQYNICVPLEIDIEINRNNGSGDIDTIDIDEITNKNSKKKKNGSQMSLF